MSEQMPKRIWVGPEPPLQASVFRGLGSVEYVRADLYKKLERRVEQLDKYATSLEDQLHKIEFEEGER